MGKHKSERKEEQRGLHRKRKNTKEARRARQPDRDRLRQGVCQGPAEGCREKRQPKKCHLDSHSGVSRLRLLIRRARVCVSRGPSVSCERKELVTGGKGLAWKLAFWTLRESLRHLGWGSSAGCPGRAACHADGAACGTHGVSPGHVQ